jgi:hypothetical protein
MKHLALAVVLACMLSGTAQAGEIPSTGVVAPPPSSSVSATGEIPVNDALAPQSSSPLLTIILTIIRIAR